MRRVEAAAAHPLVKICSVSQCSSLKAGATKPLVTPRSLPSSPPACVFVCEASVWVGGPSQGVWLLGHLATAGNGGRLPSPRASLRPTLSARHPVEGTERRPGDAQTARCGGRLDLLKRDEGAAATAGPARLARAAGALDRLLLLLLL